MSPVRKCSDPLNKTIINGAGQVEAVASESVATINARIRVVTPIIGGGFDAVESQDVDCVRPSEIRGHLRFWWRATVCGSQCDGRGLLEMERALFGGVGGVAGVPSQLRVEVSAVRAGSYKPSGHHEAREGGQPKALPRFTCGPSYAMWPLQQDKDVRNRQEYKGRRCPTKQVREGVEFCLSLSFPKDIETQVLGAFRAWVLFGGYGARTRRGLGSLDVLEFLLNGRVDGVAFSPPSISSRIGGRRSLDSGIYGDALGRFKWPRLFGSVLCVGSRRDQPREAWEDAIKALEKFRQGEDIGRRARAAQGERPGRSYWPEPDFLRSIRGGISPNLDWGVHAPVEPVIGHLLRQDFGLPIHFKFLESNGRHQDPEANAKLSHKSTDRFASPVIIKAMPVTENGRRRWAPIALFLNCPRPSELEDSIVLKFDSAGAGEFHDPGRSVTAAELNPDAATANVRPIGVSNIGALDAFRNFLREKYDAFEVTL